MSNVLHLALVFLLGGLLGVIFFGGLWWTILKSVSSSHAALWFFASMLLRTGIALAGFYYFSQGHWERLVACLVGFFITREILLGFLRPEKTKGASAGKGGNHAH